MQKQMTKQDAIETLEIFRDDYTREDSAICQAIDIAIDALKQTTIAPEVRNGRWIALEGWFNKSIVKCSVCGNTLNMDGVNAGRGDANYCPNCGSMNSEV